ncbi:LamG domain-containing protein [Gangjinia marincola]|uniref:LamG domain-containing protein n=1 Tax=Gangjinia marincola TaxID=578463 RepID=A0ABN1MH49_9FLAO
MKNKCIYIVIATGLFFSACNDDDETLTSTPAEENYPTDGLVAYFPFDSSYQDVVTTETQETPTGNLAYTVDREGKSGSAIEFLGNEQYLEVELAGSLTGSPNHEASIAVWVLPNPDGLGGTRLLAETTLASFQCRSFKNTSLKIGGSFAYGLEENPTGTTGIATGSSKSVAENTWVHIALTVGNGEFRIYVNGELIYSDNVFEHNGQPVEPIFEPFNQFVLGANYTKGEYWIGVMDDLFFYKRMLTQEEINLLYTL